MTDPASPMAVADRFMAALDAADEETVRAIYAPNVRIWHNFRKGLQSIDENIQSMHWVHSKLSGLHYDVQVRHEVPGGFFQQHFLRGTLTSGEAFAMPACAICRVEDGRITSLEEYLDPAQAAPLMK